MRTARYTRCIVRVVTESSQADVSPTVVQRVIDLLDPAVATVAADRGIDLRYCDGALPQDWYDMASSLSGQNPQGHIVWSYLDSIPGEPVALTPEGDLILALMDLGSPLTNEVHDDNRARLQGLIGNALRTLRQED